MQIKVRIVKKQNFINLNKGDVTYALAFECEKVGVFEEKAEDNEKFMDEDDEDYLDDKAKAQKEKYVGVQTYVLVIDRRGMFVWIESECVKCIDSKCKVVRHKIRKPENVCRRNKKNPGSDVSSPRKRNK